MPRPKLNRDPFTITMPTVLMDAIDKLAQAGGVTRSALIEQACRAELRKRRVSLPQREGESDTPTCLENADPHFRATKADGVGDSPIVG